MRDALAEVSDRMPPPLTIRIYGVIEAGARLSFLADVGLPKVSEAYTYRHDNEERPEGSCRQQ